MDIEFDESIMNDNGDIFQFKYEGVQKSDKDIDISKIHDLIVKFMNQNHRNMVKNVKFLRTILKDYDEKYLSLSYKNDEVVESVQFNSSQLVLFEKEEKIKENKGKIIVNYNPFVGVNFKFNHFKDKEINNSKVKEISEDVYDVLNEIGCLNYVEPIKLDWDAKTIIGIYRLFYNENPDFSDKNINIKIQAMISILAEFHISVGDYDFSLSGKRNIPMSMDLLNIVYELFPLGEVKDVEDQIKFREDAKKTISIIGEEIRNSIKSSNNREEDLITISKVIHAARYHLASTLNVDDVLKCTNCSSDEVESSMKLVKKINKKITT